MVMLTGRVSASLLSEARTALFAGVAQNAIRQISLTSFKVARIRQYWSDSWMSGFEISGQFIPGNHIVEDCHGHMFYQWPK